MIMVYVHQQYNSGVYEMVTYFLCESETGFEGILKAFQWFFEHYQLWNKNAAISGTALKGLPH